MDIAFVDFLNIYFLLAYGGMDILCRPNVGIFATAWKMIILQFV